MGGLSNHRNAQTTFATIIANHPRREAWDWEAQTLFTRAA